MDLDRHDYHAPGTAEISGGAVYHCPRTKGCSLQHGKMGNHRRESERVTILRTTVIMKTDISGSTTRFRALPESDLHALLSEHRKLLTDHAAAHGGYIVKPEGDGFWLVFPSVTGA